MCKTIKQKVKFKAAPLDVYRLLVDPDQHRAFTGQTATNPGSVGSRFTSYRKSISGINVDLVPGRRIVQAWRDQRFPEGIFSMVTIQLTAAAGGATELVLTHRGVPKDLIPKIEEQWRDGYWAKMREYFATAVTAA